MSTHEETTSAHQAPSTPVRRLGPVPALRYVTAPNAPTYRAIMEAFSRAKQRYQIELNEREVLELIWANGDAFDVDDERPLEVSLNSLVDWGNLAVSHDTPRAASLKDYYRKRYVYRLTAVGEAAHRAVREVEETVGRSGSLQTSMLETIRDVLYKLVLEQRSADPDAGKLVGLLHQLHAAFTSLTEEAGLFITELGRHLSAGHRDVEGFKLYKQAVLAYIGRFVSHLRRIEHQVIERLRELHDHGVDRLILHAVSAAELPPALGDSDPAAAWIAEQEQRWRGVLEWFDGRGDGELRWVDRLARFATDAVVRITQTLTRINERRTERVDRAADYRRLALWFSTCDRDEDAHRIAHAAFGVYSARHFHIGDEDDELVHPSTSWWDATPAPIPVPLRRRGRQSNAGRAATARDFSESRRWIEQLRRRERAQVETARRRFTDRGRFCLSALVSVNAEEFALLLDLLDEALCAPRSEDGSRATRTADGRLEVRLSRREDHEDFVEIITPTGRLRCRDYWIEVRDTQRSQTTKSEGLSS